jgi:hypothetical protein
VVTAAADGTVQPVQFNFGGPLAVMAVGAILYWATDFDLAGIDMDTVGLIVLIAGTVALAFSLRVAITDSQQERARRR